MVAGAFLVKVLSSALLWIALRVQLHRAVNGAPLDGIGSNTQCSECAFFNAIIAGAFLENVLSSALLRIALGVELGVTGFAALDH